jgi:hypothetical protein
VGADAYNFADRVRGKSVHLVWADAAVLRGRITIKRLAAILVGRASGTALRLYRSPAVNSLEENIMVLMGIGYLLLFVCGIGALVCFIMVLIKMFQNEQTGLAIASIVLTFICAIGPLIAFVYGWIKSSEWGLKNVMLGWTGCIVGEVFAFVLLLAGGFSMATLQQQDFRNQMQNDFESMRIEMESSMPSEFAPDNSGDFNPNSDSGFTIEPSNEPAPETSPEEN